MQPPCPSGKALSRGSHDTPSCVKDSPSRQAALAQLPAEPLVRALLLRTPVLLPIENTRHMHSTGKRPREQNLFLWSDKGYQTGCQNTWEAAAAAHGCQQVSSGVLQVYIGDMRIWGEISSFALKP